MTVLIICGSIAKKSHTKALLKFIESSLNEKRATTVFWDLKEKPLPYAIPEYHSDPTKTPDKRVKEFNAQVSAADAVVLGSPLYHGSYAGILKSALDNLGVYGLRDKPVALAANGSGPRSTTSSTMDHLRVVVRAIRGYALQGQVATNDSDYREKGAGYVLQDENMKRRCELLVNELIILAKALKGQNAVQG